MRAQSLAKLSKNHNRSLPLIPRKTFVKQFKGIGRDSGIVCFKFWELVAAAGCPHKCSYCFLQATPSYVFGYYPLSGALFENWQDMVEEVVRWLEHPVPRMLVVGELQDGLAFDNAYKQFTGKSLTEMLVPLFAQQKRHSLLFLTKSDLVHNALKMKPVNNVVFSWSINAERAARKWEKGAPSTAHRINAAKKMRDAGWHIRFRLDPMIPFKGWEDEYRTVIDQLNALEPEMITIGALRASNTLQAHSKRNGRDYSIFDLLSVKDPSGFKWRLPKDIQIDLFSFAYEHIDRNNIVTALCKEDTEIWNSLGMEFNGCNCLIGVDDEIVSKPL